MNLSETYITKTRNFQNYKKLCKDLKETDQELESEIVHYEIIYEYTTDEEVHSVGVLEDYSGILTKTPITAINK